MRGWRILESGKALEASNVEPDVLQTGSGVNS